MNGKCKIATGLLLGAANFLLHAGDVASLPAITANGIMAAGQTEQVIFKVTDKKISADQSYILSEGDERAGIKVVTIDASAGVVTFDNHGTVQKIALAKPVFTANANTASAPAQVTQPPVPTMNAPTPAPQTSQSAARGASIVVIGNRSNNYGRTSINGMTAQTGNGGGANNFNQNRSQTPGNSSQPATSSPLPSPSPAPVQAASRGPEEMSVGVDNRMVAPRSGNPQPRPLP